MSRIDAKNGVLAETWCTCAKEAGRKKNHIAFDVTQKWGFDHRLKANEISSTWIAFHELLHVIGLPHALGSCRKSVLTPHVENGSSFATNFRGKDALLNESQESLSVHGFLLGNEWGVVVRKNRRILRLNLNNFATTHELSCNRKNIPVLQASISPSGKLFVVDARNRLLTRSRNGFKLLSGRKKFQSVCGGRVVLGIEKGGKVWDIANMKRMRDYGKMKAVFVAGGCSPYDKKNVSAWALKQDGKVMAGKVCLKGTSWSLGKIPRSPSLVSISIGFLGRIVFGVCKNGHVWRRTRISFRNLKGSGWKRILAPVKMKSVHVSCKGDVYVVSRKGQVYIRTGISIEQMSGKRWKRAAVKNIKSLSINPTCWFFVCKTFWNEIFLRDKTQKLFWWTRRVWYSCQIKWKKIH